MNSYVYRGKSIPKMSGYQTAILVHKEGIMTNEEIYKYAQKAMGNRHDKLLLLSLLIGLIGFMLLLYPFIYTNYCTYLMGLFITLFLVYYSLWLRLAIIYQKQYRYYTYNLVRADERNRLQVSKR